MLKPRKSLMTTGPWHVAQNGNQVDVYARLFPDDEAPYVVAVAQKVRSDGDAEAIAMLPDLIKNGRAVLRLLKPLMKHSKVLEYPEAARLLTSVELGELARILEAVKC
jgi:hypothetical protein